MDYWKLGANAKCFDAGNFKKVERQVCVQK